MVPLRATRLSRAQLTTGVALAEYTASAHLLPLPSRVPSSDRIKRTLSLGSHP